MHRRCLPWLLVTLAANLAPIARAGDRPVVGLIPKAVKPIQLDGNLDEWDGAFVTPVHVGHPDFADRGAQFLFLWDDDALYMGLRALDRTPAHVRPDAALWDGDAVEFYLDTRPPETLGGKEFGPGTLHMFWTPFTGTAVKPRLRVRDLPAFKGLTLRGAEVAGAKTAWGYTAEFRLPWKNFPKFTPKAGAVLGIECELCSGDGGPRVDRTFVYASPAAVGSPAAFGRVRLVEKADPAELRACSRALLPLAVTRSANYAWLYATACLSPTVEKQVARVEGQILDAGGKVRKTTAGTRTTLEGSGFVLWRGAWELFDLPAGNYTLRVAALDKDGKPVVERSVPVIHGEPAPGAQNPSPMVEHTRSHPQRKAETPEGRRVKLAIGTLFVPAGLKGERVPLFLHFHGGATLAEATAARFRAAVITANLGTGSAVYGRPFADPQAFPALLKEAEEKAGVRFGPVGLTAWSAGYGAVRAILRSEAGYARVGFVLLLDGLHAGYVGGRPGPMESQLVANDLAPFVRFAKDAVAGKKQFIVTHSEVFPGTFASTTETADYLLREVGLKRTAVLRWGPLGTQQLSEARQGKLLVAGFAGNSAPDHVDHLRALPDFLAWVAWGETPEVIELWPGKVPDEAGAVGAEKVAMSPKMDRKQVEVTESTRMVTNVSKPSITVYRPAKEKDTGAAVVICPGGGYWNLYWELEGEEVAAWLNSLGVTGIVLKYRVPRRPDEPKGEPARRPLQDAQRAISLVRSKAKQWGIDPQRIGMIGFSAGGHLAIATATNFEKRAYPPTDDIDQISCRPDFAILVYPGYLKAKDKNELAAGLHIPKGTPPVFLVHGGEDLISPPEHSVVMYLALKRANVPAELHVYADTAHDFGVRRADRPYAGWTRSCADWLRQLNRSTPPGK